MALAIFAIFAYAKEAIRIPLLRNKLFFRLSGWGTPYRRVPGRIECTNLAPKWFKIVPLPLYVVSG